MVRRRTQEDSWSIALKRTGPAESAIEVERRQLTYTQTGKVASVAHKTSATGPTLRYVSYAYDARGAVSQVDKYLDDLETAAGYRATIYDEAGRLIQEQDYGLSSPDREISYDGLGRIASVTVAVGTAAEATTSYAYDAHDNLMQVTDADGRVTHYVYDDFGQLMVVDSPDSGVTRYGYDAVGNLTRKIEGDGTVTVRQYDARHRLSREFYDVDPEDLPSTPTRAYFFDEAHHADASGSCPGGEVEFAQAFVGGRLAAVEHAVGVTYYSYTPFGETAAVYEVVGTSFDLCSLVITRYAYDASARITSVTYPSGRVVRYAYTAGALGPTTVTLDEPDGSGMSTTTLASDISYAIGAQPAGYTAGAVEFAATWDYAGQALTRDYAGGAGSAFAWSVSARELDGDVLAVADDATAKLLTATYDGQDRLLEATGVAMRGYQSCVYTYDGSGNRQAETCYDKEISYTYASAASNTLASLSWPAEDLGQCSPVTATRDIARDSLGRATSGFRGKYPRANGSDSFAVRYGEFGHVSGVDTNLDETFEYGYAYDHRALRRQKTGPASMDVRYIYDAAGRLLSESDGSQTQEYVYLNGALVTVLVDTAPGTATSATQYAIAVDDLGTPQRAFDGDGDIVWAADYEAFGNASIYVPGSGAAPSLTLNVRLPGQYYDEETGLHQNWWRYYDPRTGRYLQTDPLLGLYVAGYEQPTYSYALNSPLRHTDPTGEFVPVLIIGGAAALDAIGGAAGLTALVGSAAVIGVGLGAIGDWIVGTPPVLADGPIGPQQCEMDGERGRTARPSGTDEPFKKLKPHPTKPDKVQWKDPNGKKKEGPKPPGFDDWWNSK